MLRTTSRDRGFTLIELMIVVAIIGVLAALAIPNFMRFQARSKQAEAKSNLKGLYTAENTYFAENSVYSAYFTDIGFDPMRGNRYGYFLGDSNVQSRAGAAVPTTSAMDGTQVDVLKYGTAADVPMVAYVAGSGDPGPVGLFNSNRSYLAVAVGNIDTDTGIDSWFISNETTATEANLCGNSDTVAVGGSPFNTYNDVSCN
jgi:type IV pilus assembly protein PilA